MVVPVYKEKLSVSEEEAVDRTVRVLHSRDIFFVTPDSMDSSYYKERYPTAAVETFHQKYFKGIHAYNKLLLSKHFYQRFSNYKYLLIAQPDAIILSSEDKLDYFMQPGFDYIGAPWKSDDKLYPVIFKGMDRVKVMKPLMARVGNGGFSLRKISSMLSVVETHPFAAAFSKWFKRTNEDTFLCYYLHAEKIYTMPPVHFAEEFAAEQAAKEVLNSGKIPYAIHAYEKVFGKSDVLKRYLE